MPQQGDSLIQRVAVNGNEAPKKWRGGLLNCFAGCDRVAWGSVAATCVVPYVVFGFNMKKALRLSVVWQTILFFILAPLVYYVGFGTYGAAAEHCKTPDTPECRSAMANASKFQGIMGILAVLGIVYAAWRRGQLRNKFGISGSTLGDCCIWYWCGLCALCQETRTLWHNNVNDGVWFGATNAQTTAETLPAYMAPAINTM